MSSNADPKFVPSAKALAVVDLKVGDIRTDDSVLELIKRNIEVAERSEFQNSVLTFILRKRGHSNQWIGQRLGFSERTVTRKYIEGMAILRTGETTRTVSAIRAASLSEKVTDQCTTGTGDSLSKILLLEKAAVAADLQSRFITSDNKTPDNAHVERVLDLTKEILEANSEPYTAAAIIEALPNITEQIGIQTKGRKTDPDGGASAPQAVAFHLAAALKDARAIAKAASEDYVASPADVKALLDLINYLNLDIEFSPEVALAGEVDY